MSLLKQSVLRDIAKLSETPTQGCGRGKKGLASRLADTVSSRANAEKKVTAKTTVKKATPKAKKASATK